MIVESVAGMIVVILRQRSVGAADRRFRIPGANGRNHPESALEIVARVTNTRSLNPPNQHDAALQLRYMKASRASLTISFRVAG
jgi:hypothetical protein